VVQSGIPAFLVGFVAVAALANAEVVAGAAREALLTGSDALFLLAFAGLGFDIRVDRMRAAGARPLAVVGAALVIVSAATYLLATGLF
jgi:uncharacterized membrane protein YadS